MENPNNDLNLNTEAVSNTENNTPFFSEDAIKPLLAKLNQNQYKDRVERNNLLLDLIRVKQPISKYELAKISGISYSTIKRILREFEFCNLIIITRDIGENNMPVQLVSIPKYSGEKENE